MSASERLKSVRDSLGKTQKEMAALLGLSYRTYQNYEDGVNNPGWDACEGIVRLGFNANWFLTGNGPMRRQEGTLDANGHSIIQGDNNVLHYDVHHDHPMRRAGDSAHEKFVEYFRDPIVDKFVADWKSLSEPGQMRVWTLLKEEIQREKEGKKEGE